MKTTPTPSDEKARAACEFIETHNEGSFAKLIAKAYIHADKENAAILREAFAPIFNKAASEAIAELVHKSAARAAIAKATA